MRAALALAVALFAASQAPATAAGGDPARGRALYLDSRGAPLSCGADGACHGPDPAQNLYKLLRGADNGALILNAIAGNRGGMAFIGDYLAEADVVDIAAYLGVVAIDRNAARLLGDGTAPGPGPAPGPAPGATAPVSDAPLPEVSAASPFNAGGGGCSVAADGRSDPLLPASAVACIAMLALRRARGRAPARRAVGVRRPAWRRRAAAAVVGAAAVGLLAATPSPAGALGVGDRLEPTALAGLDGAPVHVGPVPGRIVYVDLWASWCAPCRQSFPWMARMHERHRERGLDIVAVSVDARPDDARRFVARSPVPFAIALDPTGALARGLAVRTLPTSLLVDPAGRVLAVHAGFRESDRDGLERRIVAALATLTSASGDPADAAPSR